ncbi:LysE/ArgO family amino acid transporter [Salana multivorans]
MTTLLAGLGFGLGLIIAIGAQNAFVLRQGLRREHVGVVVAICALSDVVLIAVGAAGVGRLIATNQSVLTLVTVLGAVVLLGYGAMAARRAVRGEVLTVTSEDAPDPATGPPASHAQSRGSTSTLTKRSTLRSAALMALALTWLNPHVYLDTVVLLGSVSASYPRPWLFAVGAAIGSITWFSALGFGARALAPLFARPLAWRVLDSVIALVMVVIAVNLLLGLVQPG